VSNFKRRVGVFLKSVFSKNDRLSSKVLQLIELFESIIERTTHFLNIKELIELSAHLLFICGEILDAQNKFSESIDYLEKSSQLYQKAHKEKRAIFVLLRLGDLKRAISNFPESRECYNKVLEECERIEQEKLQPCSSLEKIKAEAFCGLGRINQAQGFYDIAFENMHKGLKLYQAVNDERGCADLRCNIGWIYYHTGDLNSARVEAKASLNTSEKMRLPHRIVDALNLFGATYYIVDPELAIQEYLLPAKDICIKENYREGLVESLTILSLAYLNKGDFQKALRMGQKGLDLCKLPKSKHIQTTVPDINKNQQGELRHKKANILSNQGLIYRYLNRLDRALKYHEQALSMRKELGLNTGIAESYGYLSDVYLLKSDYPKAIDYGQKALSWLNEKGVKYLQGRVDICISLGIAFEKDNQVEKARRIFKEAIDISTSIDYRLGMAISNTMMGKLYVDNQDYEKATGFLDQALNMSKDIFPDITWRVFTVYGDLYKGVANTYWNKKLRDKAKDYYERSYTFYVQAVDQIEKIRSSIFTESNKISFIADKATVYAKLILLCLKQEKFEQAFEYVQKTKSRAFLDLLASREIKGVTELTPEEAKKLKELLKKEKELRSQINGLYFQLRGGEKGESIRVSSSSPTEELKLKLNSLEKNWNEVWDYIREIDPKYTSLKQGDLISFKRLQNLLLEDTVLLEYFIAGEKIVVFVVDSEMSIPFAQVLDISSQLINLRVKDCYYRATFNPRGKSKVSWLKDLWPLKSLWNELVSPVYKIPLSPNGKSLKDFPNWYLVPHGKLYYLPFHAFCRGENKEIQYLIEQHNIVYLPSTSLIKYYKSGWSQSVESCLAVAGQTKYMQEEARAVAKIFNTRAYPASAKVIQTQMEKSDIFHFAGHGEYNKDFPLSSGLELVDAKRLTALDVFNMKFNTILIVLSACESAKNEILEGNELQGLTRAFLYAGSSVLITSLWRIDDRGTTDFMKRFYENWRLHKLNVSYALRQTQIEFIRMENNYSHPYYWAPFILVGFGK